MAFGGALRAPIAEKIELIISNIQLAREIKDSFATATLQSYGDYLEEESENSYLTNYEKLIE